VVIGPGAEVLFNALIVEWRRAGAKPQIEWRGDYMVMMAALSGGKKILERVSEG